MTPMEKMAKAICSVRYPEADWEYCRSVPVPSHSIVDDCMASARAALAALAECELPDEASRIGRETLLTYGNNTDDVFRAIIRALMEDGKT